MWCLRKKYVMYKDDSDTVIFAPSRSDDNFFYVGREYYVAYSRYGAEFVFGGTGELRFQKDKCHVVN